MQACSLLLLIGMEKHNDDISSSDKAFQQLANCTALKKSVLKGVGQETIKNLKRASLEEGNPESIWGCVLAHRRLVHSKFSSPVQQAFDNLVALPLLFRC